MAAGKLKERLKAFPRQQGETRKAWKRRSIQAVRKQNREAKSSTDQPPYNIWGYTGDGPAPPAEKASDSSKGKAAGKGKSKGKGKSSKGKGKGKGQSKGTDTSWKSKPDWWSKDSYVTRWGAKDSKSWGSSWKDDSWKSKSDSWWNPSTKWDSWSSSKKGW